MALKFFVVFIVERLNVIDFSVNVCLCVTRINPGQVLKAVPSAIHFWRLPGNIFVLLIFDHPDLFRVQVQE